MKPILFSGPMVRAILDGRKTETRRPVKPQPNDPDHYRIVGPGGGVHYTRASGDQLLEEARATSGYRVLACAEWLAEQANPFGAPGDLLWARETWQEFFADELPLDRQGGTPGRMGIPAFPERGSVVAYRADGELEHLEHGPAIWRPSIHMPRWASRLTLKVLDVRVERIQAITCESARAEGLSWVGDGAAPWGVPGMADSWSDDPRVSFRALWDSIYSEAAPWSNNPWVWVCRFEKVAPEGEADGRTS